MSNKLHHVLKRDCYVMMKIIVDADACPVKSIIINCGNKYKIKVILVHSTSHYSHSEETVKRIVVDNEYQAADMAIVNVTEENDLVITADIGLAALVLGKGAYALNPWGEFYRAEQIQQMLEERYYHLKALKENRKIKGPAARKKKDNQHFQKTLVEFIEKHYEIKNC